MGFDLERNKVCKHCKDPSKRIAGTWDGENSSGLLYDCNNLECSIKQEKTAKKEKDRGNRQETDRINKENGVDIKKLE